MSISRRIATLFRVKANKALDRAEDPREVLDYSYEQQLEMVQKVRRGLADVATSRKRVELQVTQLQLSAGKLQGQAQQVLAAGREDLAREALIRRAAVTSQVSDLQGQQASLQAEEDKLTLASQRLQAKVDAFCTRKETIKAAYTAAEAETRVGEAVSGISEEMGDVGMATQRAQDKTEQMQARAGALDELLASGALEDATVPGGRDDVQSQLDALTAGHDVDDELAQIRLSCLHPQRRRPWRGQGRHQPIRRHHRQGSRPPRERGDPGAMSAATGHWRRSWHDHRCHAERVDLSATSDSGISMSHRRVFGREDVGRASGPASVVLRW